MPRCGRTLNLLAWLALVWLGVVPASAQAPPPGAVIEPIASAQAGCSGGMTVVGLGHGPDGRAVVAWQEGCPSALRVFWARKGVGDWFPHEFNSDRRWQGGGDADLSHRLQVLPGSGMPMLVYAAPGPYNEFNSYRVNLDDTLAGSFISTYVENLAGPQTCIYPSFAPAAAPTATTEGELHTATAFYLCNDLGQVRADGATITTAPVYRPRIAYAIAGDGGRHLVWSTGTQLYYTRRAPGASTYATSPLLAGLERFGGEVKLAADATGVLHVLVRGYAADSAFDSGTLVYFRSVDGGNTWTAPEFVDPWDAVPANGGIHTDITLAVDDNGVPAVAYWKSRQQLWYAKRDGPSGSWNRAQVASRPLVDVARATALDFDAHGQPVLIYFDQPTNRLVAARPFPADPAATRTTLRVSSVLAEVGTPLEFDVTVDALVAGTGTPTGTVTLRDLTAGEVLARPALDGTGRARVVLSTLAAGVHLINATYEGTADYRTSEMSLTVTVREDGPPPAIRAIHDRTDFIGTYVEIAPEVSSPSGVPLGIAVAGLPPGATYDSSEGLIRASLNAASLGTYHVVVTVTDGFRSVSEDFLWRVRTNSPPWIVNPGNQRVPQWVDVSLSLEVGDPDGDPVQLTLLHAPDGLRLDGRTLTGSVVSGAQVIVSASDGYGGTSTVEFQWHAVAWAQASVTAAVAVAPVYQGDALTRGVLTVNVRVDELSFGAGSFGVEYTVELPSGAVFRGGEGSTRLGNDILDSTPTCRPTPESALRLACVQERPNGPFGRGRTFSLQLHFGLPPSSGPVRFQVNARLSQLLDLDTADNSVQVSLEPEIRPRTGRRAMVMVVDHNESQLTSVSWGRLSDAATNAVAMNLADVGVSEEVSNLVRLAAADPYNNTLGRLSAATRVLSNLLKSRLVASRGNSGGCYGDMLEDLLTDPELATRHPMTGFLNRYGEAWTADCLREMATPYYDRVESLTDSTATFDNFKTTVERLHDEGYEIDLILDIHGCGTPHTRNNADCGEMPWLLFADGAAPRDHNIVDQNGQRRPSLQSINSFDNGTAPPTRGYVRLNNVYMVSCWGSNFNQMWLDMGATASNGAEELNYMVIVSPFTFLDQFTRNRASLDEAARRAYEDERVLFEGVPLPFTIDFTFVPGCSQCRYTVDLGAVYARKMARHLSAAYGEDAGQLVHPIESSRRVGVVAAPVATTDQAIYVTDPATGARLAIVIPTAITFAGTMSLQTGHAGPPVDVHQGLGQPAVQYDLSTTAGLSGPTQVCFPYDPRRFTDTSTLRLLHYENGAWVDRTTSHDTVNHVICGTVTSFSPFAVVEFVNRAPTAVAGDDVMVEAASPSGAPVQLDGGASSDADGDALIFAWSWPGGSAEVAGPTVTLPPGTHVIALTVTDAFGAASVDTMTVTVAPAPLPGEMWGHGHVRVSGPRHQFEFDVRRHADQGIGGALSLKIQTVRRRGWEGEGTQVEDGRFVSAGLSFVAFADDPTVIRPRRHGSGPDAVVFAGEGSWNGMPGYRFEVRATTRQAPRSPSTIDIRVTGPDGESTVVVSGNVSGGAIVSRQPTEPERR